MAYPISVPSFERAKMVCGRICPDIKPTHRVEILAAGLGFRTHAALRSSLSYTAVECDWDEERAIARAKALSSPLMPADILSSHAIRSLGVLVHLNSWDLERVAGLADAASEDRTRLLPTSGNFGQLARAEEAARAAGVWPTEAKRGIEAAIRSMSPPELWEVEAVMWLEREKYGRPNWAYHRRHAQSIYDADSYRYVLFNGNLGTDLWIGMEMLAKGQVVATP